MEALRDYITKWDLGVEVTLPRDLPSPYHATKEFGEKLLKIQGYGERKIRDLFCIRTFALHHGISHALYLIRENIVSETNTFPHRLYEMEEIPNISKTSAADLERAFLRWELASEIPEPESFVSHSESKHIRSESVIEYSKVAMKVLNNDTNSGDYKDTYDFFKDKILQMLRKCNLINLMNKLDREPPLPILQDILKNDIYPNVLASVHGTSLPS